MKLLWFGGDRRSELLRAGALRQVAIERPERRVPGALGDRKDERVRERNLRSRAKQGERARHGVGLLACEVTRARSISTAVATSRRGAR